MLSIDRIIQRDPNPFDTETFWSGNFWQEEQNPDLTVDSIHAETIRELEAILDRVRADRRTRTVILEGETGSGKTYLLGRIKRKFNPKAFFAYIEPFTASDYIWRHILRYTVDSLLETPEGQKQSQLLLWLQGLKAFKQRSVLDRLRGERQVFIRKLMESYPSGIYNAQEFFGVLYGLTDSRTYLEACEWLRGDDLDDETLRRLGVRSCIDTEEAAQMMMANFGRIAIETKPIVLCFDQLDNIARNRDGQLDIEALFRVNAILHTQKLKNFSIVISVITDTWRQNCERIPQTDRDRIDNFLKLKQIGLDQAEALWASRLYLLHYQARPQPESPIYPLDRQHLEAKFPGGKTRPRNTLILGRRLFQEIKIALLQDDLDDRQRSPVAAIASGAATAFAPAANDAEPIEATLESSLGAPLELAEPDHSVLGDRDDNIVEAEIVHDTRETAPVARPIAPANRNPEADPRVAFKLVWRKKFQQTQSRVEKIRQYATPELIQMLAEVFDVLEIPDVRSRVLQSRTYASYSLSYRSPVTGEKVGVVWSEDVNLVKLFNMLKACKDALEADRCTALRLLRAEGMGAPSNRGYKLYQELFAIDRHRHFVPDLASVHFLVTYHSLVNDALSGDLVVGDTTPDLVRLQGLMRETGLLETCALLEQFGFAKLRAAPTGAADAPTTEAIAEFMVDRVVNQQCMAIEQLVREALTQFHGFEEERVVGLIYDLARGAQPIAVLDAEADLTEQLVYATATSDTSDTSG
ncbi:MAG: AAA family ATPase [Geitlerinemataceae cyanobacterium]